MRAKGRRKKAQPYKHQESASDYCPATCLTHRKSLIARKELLSDDIDTFDETPDD
jgi:hypothetical protein